MNILKTYNTPTKSVNNKPLYIDRETLSNEIKNKLSPGTYGGEFAINKDLVEFFESETGKKVSSITLGQCMGLAGFICNVRKIEGKTVRGYYVNQINKQ